MNAYRNLRLWGITAMGLTLLPALMFSGPASGQSFEHPILGGNGGGFFKVICPANTFWVGLEGNVGLVIDQMRLLCAPFTLLQGNGRKNWKVDANRVFNEGEIMGQSAGGGPERPICADSRFVQVVRFNTEFFQGKHLVAFVKMGCTHPFKIDESLNFGNNFPIGEVRQDCPDGMWAIGLQGRRGSFVDAIGLVCAVMPVV